MPKSTSTLRPAPKLVSFVMPMFNESGVFPAVRRRMEDLLEKLPGSEVILVDDGSRDDTAAQALAWAATERRIKVIELSRNFGHQPAICAGLQAARGDVVLVLDGDLQDPPELVFPMIEKFREGFDIVDGRRTKREGETWFKLATARAFYWVFAKLAGYGSLDGGDFRLISRQVVDALLQLPEKHCFLRGMIAWVGFPRTHVDFERPKRLAGRTKFSFWKMSRFAVDGILSFSILPLRLISLVGFLVFLFGVGYGVFGVLAFFSDSVVRGWTSMILLQSVIGGMTLLSLGTIGEYVGRIYEETKERPLFLVRRRTNFEASGAARLRPAQGSASR